MNYYLRLSDRDVDYILDFDTEDYEAYHDMVAALVNYADRVQDIIEMALEQENGS